MSLRGHLDELRRRLTIAALAVLATTIVSFVFFEQIIEFLLGPADAITDVPGRLVFTEVTEMFGVMMKVSLYSGLVLALPIVVYQIVRFASPGLTSRERKYLFTFVPGILLCFVAGAAFSYIVLIPPAIDFLVTFGPDFALPTIRISSVINTVVRLLFWMGVVFETPLVMYILARFGVASPSAFARWRRYWIVIAFVLGAIITPTIDPIFQTAVAVPLIILYEVGILLSRLAVRGRRPAPAASPVPQPPPA